MAAKLDKLIKYRDQILDDKRRGLGELLTEETRLESELGALTVQLAEESRGDLSKLPPQTLADFIEGVRYRKDIIDKQIKSLQPKITAMREEVAEAFREKKQIEIVQEERDKAQATEAARRETIELDEIAGVRAARDASVGPNK